MFTGLVEAIGTVVSLTPLESQARLVIRLPFAAELSLGDSVAINGCCLTVSEIGDSTATFDLLLQTLKVTSLGELAEGSLVNLERALRVGDRLGGHFVQGHVDATGTVRELTSIGQDHRLEIVLPKEIHQFCIDKGSLTIDGISLTIAELKSDAAVFWITPHTFEATNLQKIIPGGLVNLEADLLAKYVHKFSQH